MLTFMFALSFTFAQVFGGFGAQAKTGETSPAPAPAVAEGVADSAPATELAAEPEPAAPAAEAETKAVAAGALADLSFLGIPLAANTGQLGAQAVVKEVQSFYKETRQLTAKFRQTVHDPVFGRDSNSDGVVRIKKPGKMRWDYYGKPTRTKGVRPTKSFISDGQTLWAVHHSDKTALRKSLQQNLLPVAVTFLYGKGDLSRDFHAELDTSGKYGRKSDYVLKLTPKQPSAQYKHLWLVVDPSNYRVKQSVVLNAKGETNSFRFYEPNTDTRISDSVFDFDVRAAKRKGYRLIKAGNGE